MKAVTDSAYSGGATAAAYGYVADHGHHGNWKAGEQLPTHDGLGGLGGR